MKKYLWVFVALMAAFCLLFTFSACGGNGEEEEITGGEEGGGEEEGGEEEGGGEEGEDEDGPSLWVTAGVLYQNGKFTFKEEDGIEAEIITVPARGTDPEKPFMVELNFGGDTGKDDTPVVTGYSQLIVEFSDRGINWDWGVQWQIGGNKTLNTDSWVDAAEWGGNFDKFNTEKTVFTLDLDFDMIQLKKVVFASGGGTAGDLKIADILKVYLKK